MIASFTALFVAEGSSDQPLADVVADLFRAHGVLLDVVAPDFRLLPQGVNRDVAAKLRAGKTLLDRPADVVVVHRDADAAGSAARRTEIVGAMDKVDLDAALVPVLPVRMTEAWLLLDEVALRTVAGNPGGTHDLGLPTPAEVERHADPKTLLEQALLTAADVRGRRRDALRRRFSQNRRQLLERLDPAGPVSRLGAWQAMVSDVRLVAHHLLSSSSAG